MLLAQALPERGVALDRAIAAFVLDLDVNAAAKALGTATTDLSSKYTLMWSLQ